VIRNAAISNLVAIFSIAIFNLDSIMSNVKPPPMMDAVLEQLAGLGVTDKSITLELYCSRAGFTNMLKS